MNDWWQLSWWAAGALAVLSLVILLIALFRDRSRGRRRCPKCWYDMSVVAGMKCPECGATQKTERRFFATRRRWRGVMLALALLLFAGATAMTPAIYTGKWAKYTPMPLLRFGLSFFDREAEAVAQGGGWRTPSMLTRHERLLLAHYAARQARRVLSDPSLLEAQYSAWVSRKGNELLLGDLILTAGQLGDEAKPCLPELVELARLSDGWMSDFSWVTLQRLGPAARPVLGSLIRMAEEEDLTATRTFALVTISSIGNLDSRTIRALERIAEENRDNAIRTEAVAVLLMNDPSADRTLDVVIDHGRRADQAGRALAARMLGWYAHSRESTERPYSNATGAVWRLDFGPRGEKFPVPAPSKKGIAALGEMLKDADPEVRLIVTHVLAGVQPETSEMSPVLREAIELERVPYVRQALIDAYVKDQEADVEFILDELVAALDGSLEVRKWGAQALMTSGVRAESKAQAVAALVSPSDQSRHTMLCQVLASFGENGWRELDVLVHAPGAAGEEAATWLGATGAAKERAGEYLYRAISSDDDVVRVRAVEGIALLPGTRRKYELFRSLAANDQSPAVRREAVWGLIWHANDDEAIDVCVLGLGDADDGVRKVAARHLQQRVKASEHARERVKQLRTDPDVRIRDAVEEALQQ